MQLNSAFTRIALLMAAAAVALPAFAQWQWTDKDGRKVFSDQSPPADIKDKDIVKRPSKRTAPLAAAATLPASSVLAPAPKPTGKENELDARKKQSEKDEVLKKKAEADSQAKIRDDNCVQAKLALATLQAGVRISVMNSAGERDVLDDDKRAAETVRIKEAVNTNCKK